jgi:hypothetical protein
MRPFRRFGLAVERVPQSAICWLGQRQRDARNEDVILFDVPPLATEPLLTDWLDPHIVAAPRFPASPAHLWIFLGGSFGKPQRQVSIIDHIASIGHWAINLRYPNDWTIGRLSRHSATNHIHEALRLQILDGRPRSGLLDFPAPDCILNRLQKLLLWLAQRHPEQSWPEFLDGEEPRWDRIAVAGHSQGGGHAAIMGKCIGLERVVMLAAPADCVEGGEIPAPWLSAKGATSAEGYFGFAHTADPAISRILAAWEALGLAEFGEEIAVDRQGPPFGHSHRLLTNNVAPGGRPHGSVAADRFIPRRGDGSSAFVDVWTYLFCLVQ